MLNMKRHARLFLPLPIAATLVLSGCGSSSNDSEFDRLWNSEFYSCGTNCHNPSASDGTENGPDMSTQDGFYTNLVNKTVNNDYSGWFGRGSDCDTTPFITPSNADKSTVVTSLVQTYSDALVASNDCTVTSYNIHATNQVSLSDPQAVINWINGGASR